jgi:hypothetical protein
MQNPFQDNLRKPWLLLCTTLLVVYSIMPGAHETLFFSNAPSAPLEALMFLLSFPLGTAAGFLFHSPELGVKGRFVFWALAMGLGYAQWFHLFPALLRRRVQKTQSTTLNLRPAGSVASHRPFGLDATAAVPPALDAARPPVPQFNDRGLTPLERVFRDEE